MELPLTQRRTNEFDDRNDVLQLALGATALSARLDGLLHCHGRQSGGGAATTAATREDEELIMFVLGLVALRNQLSDRLERARAQPSPERWPEPRDQDTTPTLPGGWLR